MTYTIDRTLSNANFTDVVARTREALAEQGFGVLTEIDVKATLKSKIGVDIENYLILGACNPHMAHKALELEPRVGAMLPCNVIVRSIGGGEIMISAIDPRASMEAIENNALKSVAGDVRKMLETVVANV
jgi:uncharacterized protein (DUF302 family)